MWVPYISSSIFGEIGGSIEGVKLIGVGILTVPVKIGFLKSVKRLEHSSGVSNVRCIAIGWDLETRSIGY